MGNQNYVNKPIWWNEEKEKFGTFIIPEGMLKMKAAMGSKRVSIRSYCQYNLQMECHILFEKGFNAYQVSKSTHIPPGTVSGYYEVFIAEFPQYRK